MGCPLPPVDTLSLSLRSEPCRGGSGSLRSGGDDLKLILTDQEEISN